MSDAPAPISILPTELAFELQLNKTLTEKLKLYNTTDAQVAYKVKTTAPKRYCVRPNAGILGPKDTVEVEVLLQPLKEFPDGMVCKDKFQVLSIPVKPAEKKEDVKIYWDTITGKDEKLAPLPGNREAEIIPQKLKCSFKTAGAASFAPAANTFVTAKSDQFSEPSASHDADSAPGDHQKKYTELERKLREEVSKLELNLKAVRGERDASVETCKNTKKLYDELKASSGALATSQKGEPNMLLLGAIGIICAILGAVISGFMR